MEDYSDKTKEELLEIIQHLEKKIEQSPTDSVVDTSKKLRSKYFNRILSSLPDMLAILDHDANIVELLSSSAVNFVKRAATENKPQSNIKDFVPEETYKVIRRNMEKVFNSGKSSVDRYSMIKNGISHHYEHWLSVLDKEYLLCMCRDVSQLWKVEQTNAEQQDEIMRLNSLMEAIVNNVPVYLFIKDSGNDFKYLYWNKTFAEYSGIPMEQAIGRNDFEIFKRTEDMERFHLDDIKVIQEGKLDYFEEYMAASGEIRTITTMKRLVPSNSGHPYIIGISWDITEIKKTEKELNAARIKAEEADRLKSAFLANMSHEIRTPLNAIVGFSKLLANINDPAEKNQYAEIIEKNSELLLNLFNDILDLSGLEADTIQFNIQPFKLLDVCLQLEQQYCHKTRSGVKLILDGGDPTTFVLGDWNRTMQIISNLLSNATKFTPQGEIHFGFTTKKAFVEVYVKDTGIGIPAERVATIFQRFGKINDFVQGTGLGLTICKMLVKKMGGQIRVSSKENKGTAFFFTLPLAEK